MSGDFLLKVGQDADTLAAGLGHNVEDITEILAQLEEIIARMKTEQNSLKLIAENCHRAAKEILSQ